MKFLKGFLINIQFFTAIPITLELPMDKDHLKKAVQAFPLVGLIQGIIYSAVFYLCLEFTPFSHLACAFLLWLVTILLTGGIHLDGWMDVSDAYFSYQDQGKRLEIMKDPRTGAFGVLSILVLLSCRFLFMYESLAKVENVLFIMIAVIPFLSKTVMGVLLLTVKSAKDEGLGTLFQNAAKPQALWPYPIYLVGVLILVSLFIKEIFLIGLLILAAACCLFLFRRKAVNWFGGITGDVLGAAVEGTELILWMTVWLLHYFVMV
ncbi:adenosylcobinamide-GDP ribazoletransferase [Bacillus sp. ISL-40]|uniref:adenosylcobinamide-GDP ribazoletransferase n=1 Tax=unclassified Bacillus (in: firmicutes) TaxID=185979 RepID=UPI001BE812A3|nr:MULTISPECIES: adenosylcobinamide-GDP ribazoletransferase [unclassified Bacillus (in: firmicutes)]MBT2696312.1 adenosylcobinamide-GDP ribazoletransferase [Bacillus sp. ISL-40]MBT2720467.1 adenosylcobinamide-GDP ribazoletransferase [Bacillus sp. ISL-46]MBT2743161.1 adenosylcobinamide-GDP ribazoletransferase [Bacillus sp. ISL-77]